MIRRATALASVVLLLASPAAAQDAGDYADVLCDVQVGYEDEAIEEGFLTGADLDDLEDVTDDLQSSDAWFRVMVLGLPVESADTTQAFAEDLLDRLGGRGRVVVFDPDDVGVASSVDGEDETRRAADAAFETAGDEQSLAAGVEAAAAELGATGGGTPAAQPASCEAGAAGSGGDGDDGGGGGGIVGVLVVLGLLVGAVVVVVWLVRRSSRKAAAVPLGEAEAKVRACVDEASTLIVDLAEQVDLPSTPEAARTAFTEGGAAFAELGDELEEADTREELEAVWPRLQDALARLRTAKALADGVPPPPAPTVEPLFPPLPPPSVGPVAVPPAPPPHYRQRSSNPFMTTAAMGALGVLMSRGMGSSRSRRPPWDGDLGRRRSRSASGGARRSGGISYGSRRSRGGGVRRSGSVGRRRK